MSPGQRRDGGALSFSQRGGIRLNVECIPGCVLHPEDGQARQAHVLTQLTSWKGEADRKQLNKNMMSGTSAVKKAKQRDSEGGRQGR